MRSNKSYVKETLVFVNKHLKEAGADPLDDLLPGTHNGQCCPVSTSLASGYKTPYTCSGELEWPAYIYVGSIESFDARDRIKQTRAVRRFVRAFDTGRLPEYHI